jgi:hypothetical protein
MDACLCVLPDARRRGIPVPSSLEQWCRLPGNGATDRGSLGLNWGAGLYFNYAFTVVWIADVAWWWRTGPDGYRAGPWWVTVAVHSFFGFMFFNAAVVFGSGFVRWFGVASMLMLAVVAGTRGRRRFWK